MAVGLAVSVPVAGTSGVGVAGWVAVAVFVGDVVAVPVSAGAIDGRCEGVGATPDGEGVTGGASKLRSRVWQAGEETAPRNNNNVRYSSRFTERRPSLILNVLNHTVSAGRAPATDCLPRFLTL